MFYSIFDFTFARHTGLSDRLFFLLDEKVGFYLLFALVVVTNKENPVEKNKLHNEADVRMRGSSACSTFRTFIR